MLRRYINLTLTLLMPISLLSVIIATLIFTLKFELNEAIKLGILAGVAAGIGLSFLLALILMFKRRVEYAVTHPHEESFPNEEPTLYETPLSKQDHTFILFMDSTLAFETSIYTVTKNLLGEVIRTDEKQGIIEIKDEENDTFLLNINPLTIHSSIIKIESSENSRTLEDIFSALKGMDRSFMRY